MMLKRRNLRVLLGAVAATMVAWACDTPGRLATSPPELPNFHEVLGPACFRMTGGGRIDTREDPTVPVPPTKNTPESHDFATFGFQARPNQCGEFPGTANMAWVEHNPDAIPVGAFTFHFHGDISFFAVKTTTRRTRTRSAEASRVTPDGQEPATGRRSRIWSSPWTTTATRASPASTTTTSVSASPVSRVAARTAARAS